MTREDDIQWAKDALEGKVENKVEEISNEQVWNSLKRNILNLSNEFDSSFTTPKSKVFSSNVISGLLSL